MATRETDRNRPDHDQGASTSGAVDSADAQTEALVERIFGATIGTLEVAAIYVGDRLGASARLSTWVICAR